MFYNSQFILLTILFRAWRMKLKFHRESLWSLPLPGSVRNHILHHTHTILSHNCTNSFFLSTNQSSQATFWLLRCHEPSLTKFCSVLLNLPTCAIISSIPFTKRNREFLYNIFLIRQGKRNWNRDNLAVVKKCINFHCINNWRSRSMPLLLQFRCSKPFQISGLGTGNWFSYAQTLQTDD